MRKRILIITMILFVIMQGCAGKEAGNPANSAESDNTKKETLREKAEREGDTATLEHLDKAKAAAERRRVFKESAVHKAADEYLKQLINGVIKDPVMADIEILEGNREFTDEELNSTPETKEQWQEFFTNTRTVIEIDPQDQAYDADEITTAIAQGGVSADLYFRDTRRDMVYHLNGVSGEAESERIPGY